MKAELTRRMDSVMENLHKHFSGLRAGRAAPALLLSLNVEVYGGRQPLSRLATVSAEGPNALRVQVWAADAVGACDRAIRNAALGLNPQVEGQVLRVPMPPLTAERRDELAKQAARYADDGKIALRAVRRDGMEHVRLLVGSGQVSQDEAKRRTAAVQKLTDDYVGRIEVALKDKECDVRIP